MICCSPLAGREKTEHSTGSCPRRLLKFSFHRNAVFCNKKLDWKWGLNFWTLLNQNIPKSFKNMAQGEETSNGRKNWWWRGKAEVRRINCHFGTFFRNKARSLGGSKKWTINLQSRCSSWVLPNILGQVYLSLIFWVKELTSNIKN